MTRQHSFLLTVLLCAASTAASAQAPPTPTTPPQATMPPSPSRGGDCASRGAGSDATTTGQSGLPLGDKLAKSDGVLCPPTGVDPEIRAPTPDVGKMPVIPPPGSPGGDPTVRPK
jgi:hypothetical protein